MSWRDRAKKVETNNPSLPSQGASSWRSRGKVVAAPPKPSTIQEMHPKLDVADRLIAKNFAQSPQKQLEYFQSKYPDMDIDMSEKGQIRLKDKDARDWNVVDPDTGFFSKDFLNDTGDIGYDIYSGVSEGAATALAALAGGASTGGVGAIPSAMAAGGASGAANEAIRQKLGAALGIPQEVSGTDVAIIGGIGAVAPVLFGAGKAKGLVQGAGTLGKKGLSKINPGFWLGEKVSGIPRQAIRNYTDDATRETVERLNREGVYDYSGQALDKIDDYITSNKNAATEDLVSAIEGAGRKANIKPAKETFKQSQKELSKRASLTNADKLKADQVKAIKDQYLGLNKKRLPENFDQLTPFEKTKVLRKVQQGPKGKFVPDEIDAKRAWDIQKDLKQAAKFEQGMTPADRYAKGTARDAYFKINQALDEASDGLSSNAKQRFKDSVTAEEEILGKLTGKTRADSVDKTFKKLSNIDRQANKVFSERLQRISPDYVKPDVEDIPWYNIPKRIKGTTVPKTDAGVDDIMNSARVLNTYKYFGEDPGQTLMAVATSGNKVPLSTGLGLLGGYAGHQGGMTGQPGIDSALGAGAGILAGQTFGSKAALRNYIKSLRWAANLKKGLTPTQTPLYRGLKTGLGAELIDESTDR